MFSQNTSIKYFNLNYSLKYLFPPIPRHDVLVLINFILGKKKKNYFGPFYIKEVQ